MQPDLPEPVVPAMRMCGMRARSAHTARAGDVLAEPDGERARGRGQVVVDVAERDEVRREVRDLDADGLLAGDRREDADLGRRERVGEVVLERGDLRTFVSRRELQLVARDARPAIWPTRCASTPKCASAWSSSASRSSRLLLRAGPSWRGSAGGRRVRELVVGRARSRPARRGRARAPPARRLLDVVLELVEQRRAEAPASH